MGEAMYYFKAEFPTEEEAKNGAIKIKNFLTEMGKAYKYWQANRRAGVWKDIQKKFPDVAEVIKKYVEYEMENLKGDDNNALAGFLIAYNPKGEGYVFSVKGKNVLYSQMVWHFDNWNPLVDYVKSIGGKAKWVSEEDLKPTDRFKMI